MRSSLASCPRALASWLKSGIALAVIGRPVPGLASLLLPYAYHTSGALLGHHIIWIPKGGSAAGCRLRGLPDQRDGLRVGGQLPETYGERDAQERVPKAPPTAWTGSPGSRPGAFRSRCQLPESPGMPQLPGKLDDRFPPLSRAPRWHFVIRASSITS